MRQHQKGPPPPELARYTKNPAVTWSGCKDKPALRRALFAEQQGLCAYCLSALARPDRDPHPLPEEGGMKIEHWRARNEPGIDATERHQRSFSWQNLLGVCPGGVTRRPADGARPKRRPLLHCDAFRQDAPLPRSPAEPSHRVEHLFTLSVVGELLIAPGLTTDDQRDAEALRDALNLNAPRLVAQRASEVQALLGLLVAGTAISTVLAALHQPDAHGALPAYCTLLVPLLP